MSKISTAVFQKSKKGNYTCGDSYFFEETEDGFLCAIADGLGSGDMAKESSQLAVDEIKALKDSAPDEILRNINRVLIGKRGVVIGILKLDFKKGTFSFLSVGNIGLIAINADHQKYRYISNAGYLAGYQRSFKFEEKKLEPNMNFLLFSDGVSERELSKDYMKGSNVNDLITLYSHLSDEVRKDDTTLIAMRYEED